MKETLEANDSQLEAQESDSKEKQAQVRKVLLSSYLGSSVEYYDFLVYGTAASLVFGQLFFSNLTPLVGTIMSFATLAVGYVARPLGGAIFGHYGDILGRKKMLVLTMVLMGVASTCIGLIPTQSQIGMAAPLLLVFLRLIQGIAVGGEWGGATLMALEHSNSNKRGFSVGIVNAGAPTGALLASVVMGIFSFLPDEQFLSWGWRIPFLISVALVAVALWIRLGVEESPVFKEAQAKVEEAEAKFKKRRPPIVEVLRHPKPLLLSMCSGIAPLGVQSLLATFALTFAVGGGADRTTALFAMAAASVVNIFTLPLFSALSDRVGRRPVLLTGLILAALLALPVFSFIGSGQTTLIYVGYFIGYGLLVGMMLGTLSAFISEQFSTGSRYTGASLGYQLGATLGAGFSPMIATALLNQAGTHTAVPIAIYVAIIAAISAIAVLLSRESSRLNLNA
ncbi:MFS transporter [Corynebacterium sp. S7]